MPRVTLPAGARTVAMDGTDRYTASPGDTVRVSPGQAAALAKHARSGRRAGRGLRLAVGTKRGRLCPQCRRLWNAWSTCCPRCGTTTVPDTPEVQEEIQESLDGR